MIQISKTKKGTDKIEYILNDVVIGRLYIKQNGMFCSFRVKNEYTRRGIGSLILKALIDNFKDRGLFAYASPKFYDQTLESKEQKRIELIEFYKRNGFKHVGKSKIIYELSERN